jgi:hypothetical protein
MIGYCAKAVGFVQLTRKKKDTSANMVILILKFI